MATDNPNGFRLERILGGASGAGAVEHAETAADTDIAAGDALIWSSGYLDVATASDAEIAGVSLEDITGESGVNKDIAYVPATEMTIFSAQCSGTPTVSHRGTTVDIEGSSGSMEVNEDSTSGGQVFRVQGIVSGYSWGNANARVYGVFQKSGWTGRS